MKRQGFTLVELLIVITIIGLLAGILFPALQHAVEEANRATCKANLKQVGTAGQSYGTSHRQRWPDVMSESTRWDEIGTARADYYHYETGDKETADDIAPADVDGAVESNTANLWKLITSAGAAAGVFVCPSTEHMIDERVVNPSDVRDFRNELYCSYSYQNVLGSYTLTQTGTDQPSRFAVAADANPQRGDYYSASGGSRARSNAGPTDTELASEPRFEPSEITDKWNEDLAGAGLTDAWNLNSPNHAFQGQNVLYLDGHVEWTIHPYCGLGYDNIWTKLPDGVDTSINPSEWSEVETLAEDNYDGTTELPSGDMRDSFLVP